MRGFVCFFFPLRVDDFLFYVKQIKSGNFCASKRPQQQLPALFRQWERVRSHSPVCWVNPRALQTHLVPRFWVRTPRGCTHSPFLAVSGRVSPSAASRKFVLLFLVSPRVILPANGGCGAGTGPPCPSVLGCGFAVGSFGQGDAIRDLSGLTGTSIPAGSPRGGPRLPSDPGCAHGVRGQGGALFHSLTDHPPSLSFAFHGKGLPDLSFPRFPCSAAGAGAGELDSTRRKPKHRDLL